MLVRQRKQPDEIDPTVVGRVTDDVIAALQGIITASGKFIVNPTLWYGRNRQGKVTVQVVNSATFLSKTFQNFIQVQRGWEKEKVLSGQRIDAYIELPSEPGFNLDKAQMGRFLDQYTTAHPEASVDAIFFRYGKRSCFNLSGLDQSFHGYFAQASVTTKVRVGLEFETGNIASSFRSLNKLNFLFRKGEIDAGVFITSVDKATTATKIWPVSNRNGSFEELENRNYHETITFPIWEFSFAPDGLDIAAPYLGANGSTFVPANTGRTVTIGGLPYEEWTGDGKELLKLG